MASRQRSKKRATGSDHAAGKTVSWVPWALFAVTLFVFLPAVSYDFVNWDDDHNLVDNPHYRGLSLSHLEWMFTTVHLGHYHPLTWITLGFDYLLWGMNPRGYHFTNIVLHAATAVLVYFLVLELLQLARRERRTTFELQCGAAFGTLFFAIHPLRVESVAWVSERRDVLSGLFYAATILLYLRGRWMGAIGAFAAAVFSKVIVVSLPLVLLVLDLYPLRRKPGFRLIGEKAPFFALALIAGLITLGAQRSGVSGTFADIGVSPLLRVTLSLYGLAFYLWKTVLPFGLYPQYVYSAHPQPFDTPLVVASLAVAAIAALAIVSWRCWPPALAAWICYLVTLLPVLSLLRLDTQQYVADHHSYLATLAIAPIAAGGVLYLFQRRGPILAMGVAAVITLALCERTVRQLPIWENSETLWTYTLQGSPLSVVAHNNLGRALASKGETGKALDHFRKAVEIRPDYTHARYNLGNLLLELGQDAEAEGHLRRAIDREPRVASAHNDLANSLLRQGRAEEALAHYREALRIDPGFADAHYNLAVALHRLGRVAEAGEHYRQATLLNPRHADAHNNWGVLLESQGDTKQAIVHYRRALEIDPRNADAQRNLNAATSRGSG